jgi:CDP-6-deoxy-D-xylo-4-hexulose-3-dehydrase
MDRLLEICEKHSIELLLDNCDSLGSTWRGKYLNEYAIASSTSFLPSTPYQHWGRRHGFLEYQGNYKIARSLAWWGRACDCVGATNLLPCGGCGKRFDNWLPDYDGVVDHRYVFTNIGYNLKPLDFQGAIGSVQLEKFEEIEQRRIQSKKRLQGILEEYVEGIKVPNELPEAKLVGLVRLLYVPILNPSDRS